MDLLKQTLKSFTRKERAVLLVLGLLFMFSAYQLFIGRQSTAEHSQMKAYTEGLVGEIVHLNPVFTEFSEPDADISSLIFSGLAKYNAVTGDFEPGLATHSLSVDKLVYTFTLKNDLYWHDGEPVTADDVYFTFAEVIQSPDFNNPVLKSNFDGVKIEQVDSRTVTFELSSVNSFFYSGMTVGILPHHILGDVPVSELDTHEFNKEPIGTGPYRVAGPYSFEEDGSTSVTLERFEDYYGEKPHIQNLRFIAFPTLEDLLANRSKWHGASRIPGHILNEIDLEGLVTHQYELPQYSALFFNTDAEFLTKNAVRTGISSAIDKQAILDAIGYKVQIDSPILAIEHEGITHTRDIEAAKEALFSAGWSMPKTGDFRINAQEEVLSLRLVRRDFSGVNETQERIAESTADLIKEQLEEIGVQVLIEKYPLAELQVRIEERDYDMLLYGQSLGYNLDTFSYWHSSQANANGLNLSNYQNPKADFQIELIRELFTDEEREEPLLALTEIILEDAPALFLYTPSYYYLADLKLTGVELQNILLPKDRFANIETWLFN